MGQAVYQVCPECLEIQISVADEQGHAGSAFCTRNSNAVDARLSDPRKRADNLRHFERRNVFTLPAKGVADAIDEIEIALPVRPHQVTGTVPCVSRREHVAKNLLFRGLRAGITLESTADVRRVLEKLADRLSGFIR